MSILFSEIYTKAIALFDDPKVTVAYNTNEIQFQKIMYTFMQNAIAMFTNPSSIGMRLANYKEPKGIMQSFESDGKTLKFDLDKDFEILDNSLYCFIAGQKIVEADLDTQGRTVTFHDILPEGAQYAIEQYYCGEFLDDFANLNARTGSANGLIVGEIKDILARLLVKAWADSNRNELLDIKNMLQDSDFKLSSNASILSAKNIWIDKLETEVMQLQGRLAWQIRFANGSKNIGRG